MKQGNARLCLGNYNIPRGQIALAIVVAILIISNLLKPLAGDVIVSFGSAIQADTLPYDFPYNVYKSWNLRGIGYKYFLYGLYRLSAVLVDTRDLLRFQVVSKLIYYTFLFTGIYLLCRMVRGELDKVQIKPDQAFVIAFVAIMTSSQWLSLQAEELALLPALGMTVFSLSDRRLPNYLAGLFFPLLLACKLVTAMYALFPVTLLLLLGKDYRARLARLLLSLTTCSLLTMIFYLYVIPLEIEDTIHATWFQSSFRLTGISTVKGFAKGMLIAVQHAPFILTGLVFSVIGMWYVGKRKLLRRLLLFGLCFAVCSVPVVVQGKWFAYHYHSFYMFAFLTVLMTLIGVSPVTQRRLQNWILALTLAVWVLSVQVVTAGLPYRDPLANSHYYAHHVYYPRLRTLQQIDAEFNLSDEPEMLFLGDGLANYVIRSRSYLRYFYPLPLQRAESNPDLVNTTLYQEQLAALLNYNGRYIYLESWFPLSRFPAIEAKIQNEYEVVFYAPEVVASREVTVLRIRGRGR